MPVDFPAYVEAQTAQLKKLAAFAQERGYWLWFRPHSNEPLLPNMIARSTSNALQRMLADHADAYGRRHPLPITVSLYPVSMEASRASGKMVLDDPVDPNARIGVAFDIPNRVKFKPIIGALSLISETHDHLYQPGRMLFCHHPMSDRHEYYGSGKAALAAVLPILDLPENRALLKG